MRHACGTIRSYVYRLLTEGMEETMYKRGVVKEGTIKRVVDKQQVCTAHCLLDAVNSSAYRLLMNVRCADWCRLSAASTLWTLRACFRQ
jgi:hypothetical protein